MSTKRPSLLSPLLAAVLAINSLNVFASGPISNNPDDYDVPKYSRIHDGAVARLRQSEALLRSLDQRMQKEAAELNREQAVLNNLLRDIESNRQAIIAAEARVAQLRQSVATARNELRQIDQEIPGVEVQLVDERRKLQQMQSRIADAERHAIAQEAVATDKTQRAKQLSDSVEPQRKQLAQLQAQLNDATAKLAVAENTKLNAQKQVDSLNAQIAAKGKSLQDLKNAAAGLEADVAQKQKAYNQALAAADKAEDQARDAEKKNSPDARQKRERAHGLRRRAATLHGELAQAQRSLSTVNEQINNLNAEITKLAGQLAQAQQRVNDANAQIPALRSQVADLQPKVNAAQAEFNRTNQAVIVAQNEAAAAQKSATEARNSVNNLKAGVAGSERRVADLQARVNSLQGRKANLAQAIGKWNAEADGEWRVVAGARERNRVLGQQADAQKARVNNATVEYNRAVNDRNQAAAVVQNDAHAVAAAHARLTQVINNLNHGITVASNEGNADGNFDGSAEGSRAGHANGNREGLEVGEREGRIQGTKEGVERARAEGKAQGDQDGAAEGSQKGTTDGTALGKKEGQEEGRARGLKEGYDAGHDEGYAENYPKGEAAGHAMGGHKKGRAEGYAEGKAKAEAEGGVKGRVDGAAQGEAEFMNANLADVTVPNVKSASYAYPQWGGYNPRRNYPHPELNAAYNGAYSQAFQAAAAHAYDNAYQGAYGQARAKAYEQARTEYANRDYPADRQAAYDAARNASYATAYAQAKNAAYETAYRPVFEAARKAALPVRREEGKAAGRAKGFEEGKKNAYEADLAAGREEGRNAGWNENYDRVYAAAKAKAYKEKVDYFSQNAVLKYDGALLVDANDDNVSAPGETLSVAVTFKNFGKVSQDKPITVALSGQSQNLSLEVANDTLAPLPGQSRAVVTGVTKLRISPAAEAGANESVRVTISQNGKVLGQTTLSLVVGYPYAVAQVNHSEYPSAGHENLVSVKVRNGSSKASASDVTVRLISTDGLATVTGAAQNVGVLTAGEVKAAELAFTFNESNANKVLGFEIQVIENNQLLGKRRFTVDSAKRWRYNPDSTGLFLLASGDAGERAETVSKLAGLGFDAYDVRVEGDLTSEVAGKYLGKAIVVPSLSSYFTQNTATALETFMGRGGHVLAGSKGEVLHHTLIGQAISRATYGKVEQILQGFKVHARNQFLNASSTAIIMETLDIKVHTPADFAKNLILFDLLRKPFHAQLQALSSAVNSGVGGRITVTRDVVLYTLTKEMSDNKAINGEKFKKEKGNRHLNLFVNTTLSKPAGAERKGLLMIYPHIEKSRKAYEKDGWFRSTPILDMIKPLRNAYEREVLGRKGS